MNPRHIRPGINIGARVVRSLQDGGIGVMVNFSDGSTAWYDYGKPVRTFQDPPVRTYREPFPAGPVASNDGASARRVRVSDGVWRGEAGGFSVRRAANMRSLDFNGYWRPAAKANS